MRVHACACVYVCVHGGNYRLGHSLVSCFLVGPLRVCAAHCVCAAHGPAGAPPCAHPRCTTPWPLQVLKYLDGTIKALNYNIGKRDISSITCMEWVPPDSNDLKEKLLLGSAEGEVLLLEVRPWGCAGQGKGCALLLQGRVRGMCRAGETWWNV